MLSEGPFLVKIFYTRWIFLHPYSSRCSLKVCYRRTSNIYVRVPILVLLPEYYHDSGISVRGSHFRGRRKRHAANTAQMGTYVNRGISFRCDNISVLINWSWTRVTAQAVWRWLSNTAPHVSYRFYPSKHHPTIAHRPLIRQHIITSFSF
jgi:hypothetical protein